MRRIKPIHVVIMIIFITLSIIYVNYDIRQKEKINEQLNIEYPLIKSDEQVDGVVTSIFLPEGFRDNPHYAKIVLNGTTKKSIVAYFDSNRNTLDDVLKVGSRLIKGRESDTICIQNLHEKDTLRYYFRVDIYESWK